MAAAYLSTTYLAWHQLRSIGKTFFDEGILPFGLDLYFVISVLILFNYFKVCILIRLFCNVKVYRI